MSLYNKLPYGVRVALQVLMTIPLAVALIVLLLVLFLGWGGNAALAFIKAWDDLVIRIGEDDDGDYD